MLTTRRLALAAAFLLVGSAALAQGTAAPGADPDLARIGQKLKPNDTLIVRLSDGTTVKGRLGQLTAESLSVLVDGTPRAIPASSVNQIQRKRRGMLLGAIIGGAIGAAFSAATASYINNEGGSGALALLPFAAGLGAGIAIDASVNFPRTVYKREPPRVGLLLQPGRIGVQAKFTF